MSRASKSVVPGAGYSSAGLQSLPSSSDEYIHTKQYLSSCLPKASIDKLTIIKIDNADLTVRFERRSQKLLKLAGWSNMKNLSADNNDVSMLSNRGFVFGKGTSGMEFSTGVLAGITAPDPGAISKEHTFVYSDIAVGRAFVHDNIESTHDTKIPETFDSFYISPVKLDANDDGEFDLFEYQQAAQFDERDPSLYEHKYFIKDVSQLLPKYIVKFSLCSSDNNNMNMKNKSPEEASTPNSSNSLDEPDFFDPVSHRPVTLREKMRVGGSRLLISVDSAYVNMEHGLVMLYVVCLEGHISVISIVVMSHYNWRSRKP
jgi:hypothetical protein